MEAAAAVQVAMVDPSVAPLVAGAGLLGALMASAAEAMATAETVEVVTVTSLHSLRNSVYSSIRARRSCTPPCPPACSRGSMRRRRRSTMGSCPRLGTGSSTPALDSEWQVAAVAEAQVARVVHVAAQMVAGAVLSVEAAEVQAVRVDSSVEQMVAAAGRLGAATVDQ